jgi:DNA replication and repair protein RecF
VIVGHNAIGKTNVLESLFMLSTGKSFKAKVEEEVINYDKDIARIKGLALNGERIELEMTLTRGLIDIGAERAEKVARKKLLVNGVSKRLVDFAGNFKTTLFGPWDLDLVTESPSIRRRFLDTVLSQVDREYRRSVLSYEKGLRQRNRLLWRVREEGIPRSQLLFWNQLLIKNGDYISQKREEFVNFVNSTKSQKYTDYKIEYDKSVISEGRLEQYKDEEVASATTLVGPHRDDFIFWEGKRNLASYGSRGEQRMGVLWLKMAELSLIEDKTGGRPTLLLDDIFSELDHGHRDVVMELSEKQQTIITTADEHFVEDFSKALLIKL